MYLLFFSSSPLVIHLSPSSLSLYHLVVFLSRGNAEGIFCLVLTMDTFFLCCIIFLKRLSFCVNMTWSFWWWSDLIIVVVLNSLHLISFYFIEKTLLFKLIKFVHILYKNICWKKTKKNCDSKNFIQHSFFSFNSSPSAICCKKCIKKHHRKAYARL